MSASTNPAVRGMLIYVIALVMLGIIIGAIYTVYGKPSNPSKPSAAEVIQTPTASSQPAR